MKENKPRTNMMIAKSFPMLAARWVAFMYGIWVANQARRRRPPSMGKAGSRLKSMRMMFKRPSIQSIMPRGLPSSSNVARRIPIRPRMPLTAGPAKAIWSSRRGFLGISSMAETPPKK